MARSMGHRGVTLLTVPVTVVVLASSVLTACGGAEPRASGNLPFDLDLDALRASPKKIFAHYMPSMPLSFDNKEKSADYWTRNYLNPDGESGKHAEYGGFTRDAPGARDPVSGDYKLLNMEEEVRQAIAAGIDGFSIDLLTLNDSNNNTINTRTLIQAAENVDPGFKIMLLPDMTTSTGNLSPADLAKWMADFARSPAVYRLDDGRLVIAPFKAEKKNYDYWSQFLDAMKNQQKIDVAFVPIFLDERNYIDQWKPLTYGVSVWGNRNPAANDPDKWKARADKVHANGDLWMQSVSFQDERPREGIYDEAENTVNLRSTWEVTRATDAEWVQLITWNDYAEGTQLAPSDFHGWSVLDINAYYASWWKTGQQPAITTDVVYLTHRPQPLSSLPSYPQTLLMDLRGGSSPARDTVEALAFLTAPATVAVAAGGETVTCDAPAGVSRCTVPLALGGVQAQVLRGGKVTASVTSPYGVTDAPYTQDFQYVAASSAREGDDVPFPTPTVTGTPTTPPVTTTTTTTTSPAGETVTVTPAADTYANELDAGANYGTSSSLASRGSPGYASYLRFVLPRTPAGKRLASATLSVRTTDLDSAGSPEAHRVWLADDGWDERTLSWNSRPAASSTMLGTIQGATASNTQYRTALSAAELAKLAGTQVTLMVTGTGTDNFWFWSANHANASYRPQLALTYVAAEPTTVKVTPLADSYANELDADANYGTSSSLASRGSAGYQAYLRFELPAAPAGTTLRSAALSFRTTDLDGAGSTAWHNVMVADDGWEESTLTWNRRPATSTTKVGVIQGAPWANTIYSAALSTDAVARLLGTRTTLTVTSTGTDNLWFWSSNQAKESLRPQLVLTFQ